MSVSTVTDRTSYDAVKYYDFETVVYDVEGNAYDAKIKKYWLNDKIATDKIVSETPHISALKLTVDSLVFGKKRFDAEGKVQPTFVERALADWTSSSVNPPIPASLKKPFESRWPEGSTPTPPSSVRFGLTTEPQKTVQPILPRWPNYVPASQLTQEG